MCSKAVFSVLSVRAVSENFAFVNTMKYTYYELSLASLSCPILFDLYHLLPLGKDVRNENDTGYRRDILFGFIS